LRIGEYQRVASRGEPTVWEKSLTGRKREMNERKKSNGENNINCTHGGDIKMGLRRT